MAIIKKSDSPSVDEDVETLEPSYIVAKNVKYCRCFGEQFDISLKS